MRFKTRYLSNAIAEIAFVNSKMAFISGPRQCGKTTMAKAMLRQREDGEYYNWDELNFRKAWTKNPQSIISVIGDTKATPLIILDELHKAKGWKRNLKGVYDSLQNPCDLLVTGSARLNVYRKGSDSLMGRYYHFRLHPFSLAELLHNQTNWHSEPDLLEQLFTKSLNSKEESRSLLMQLDKFGPFPEPLFAQSTNILNLWQRGRVEKVVREDLRDLTRLPELSQIEMLVELLPDRVANPLSITSLSEDLEVSYTTVKRWLGYLQELYYIFVIKPYSKSIPRSAKRMGKLYLWDWTEVADEGARFENLIAMHLLKYCHYLTDTGVGEFDLYYLRNKEKLEIDFLLTKDRKPWLPIEVKLNQDMPSSNWHTFLDQLPCSKAVQITKKSNVYKVFHYDGKQVLVVSADIFLSKLV